MARIEYFLSDFKDSLTLHNSCLCLVLSTTGRYLGWVVVDSNRNNAVKDCDCPVFSSFNFEELVNLTNINLPFYATVSFTAFPK